MRTLAILTKRGKQIFPIYHSNRERERNQWNFATVVPQKFASPDFRHARVSHRFLCPLPPPDSRTSSESFQSRFGIQDPDPISGNRIVSPGDPGIAPPNAFEQLCEIELRVAATLTPPEVGVCQFLAHTHISLDPDERTVPKISLTTFAVDDRSCKDLSSPSDICRSIHFSVSRIYKFIRPYIHSFPKYTNTFSVAFIFTSIWLSIWRWARN